MTSSQGKEGRPDDTANSRSSWRRALWLWLGGVLLAIAVLLVFLGYRQPELLLEFGNLRYCG